MVKLYLVAVLCACSIAASDSLTVLVPAAPDVTPLGHTAHLPCWLSPQEDAEGLEVRWYRGDNHFDAPLLFYRQRGYAPNGEGRASFGLRDAKSDGLRAGDVTLKLVNATLQDAGVYTCYVSSDKGYDKASVNLDVTAVGSSPLLSVMWKEDGSANVSCESKGWYPNPTLQWSNQDQTLAAKGLVHSNDTSGLVSVHSWILLSTDSRVTCSVALSKDEERQGRMNLQMPSGTGGSTTAWKVVFILTLMALLVSMAILAVKHFRSNKDREKRSLHELENGTAQERTALTTNQDTSECADTPNLKIQHTALDNATTHQVNVTLDETVNEYLKMKVKPDGVILRENSDTPPPDGEEVTLLTSIHGTSGFSSGQQGYWEVCLGNENAGVKKSWWIGVANVSVASIKSMPDNVPLQTVPSAGFLFLSSKVDEIWVNTQPAVVLPVTSRPEILGVYLNYDMGELSFYDVKTKKHMVTLVTKFTEKVVPFFNPGKGDKATMKIVHKINTEGTGSETEPILNEPNITTA